MVHGGQEIFGIAIVIAFAAVSAAIGLALLAFWIWMLVDCAMNETDEGNTRLIWILIILFAHILGAILYYFFQRRKRFSPPPPPLPKTG